MAKDRGAVWAFMRAAALIAAFGLLGQAFAGSGGTANGHCKDHGQGKKTGHVKCEPADPGACQQACNDDALECLASVGGDPDLFDALCRPVVLACLAACEEDAP